MTPRSLSSSVIAVAAMLAAMVHARAESQYPVANVPDIVGACRASDPPQCSVPPGEEWQAKYRDRCTEAPEQCRFRSDGTISSWTGKLRPEVAAELRAAIEHARARDAHMGPR